jgi:S-adenosylmethionine decarboxylase
LSSSTGCLSSCSKTIAVLQVVVAAPTPASAIGFEGYEKRLEISFYEAPVFADPNRRGLCALLRSLIYSISDHARCTVVSELSNEDFDSYVLSESSLFVYPYKILIKTYGTTKLLLAIPRILELAKELSLPLFCFDEEMLRSFIK